MEQIKLGENKMYKVFYFEKALNQTIFCIDCEDAASLTKTISNLKTYHIKYIVLRYNNKTSKGEKKYTILKKGLYRSYLIKEFYLLLILIIVFLVGHYSNHFF